MVIGSRVLAGSMQLFGENRVYLSSFVACYVIAFCINILYLRTGTDYYGCYKAFKTDVLKSVYVQANGFDYDSELLCKLFKQNISTVEVPTSYKSRSYHDGKKISWRDGYRVLYSIFYWRFKN
jgi:hypothetical protein